MLENYRLRMAAIGGYEGEARCNNSQKIMDASWMRDPATKPVYVKWVNSGLPIVDDDDVPVYAKFNVKSYHNITGDEVAYLLQFRKEDMKQRSDIRPGSYVQIHNEMDEPEWWLIVHLDDRTQFRQFSIVKCTWVYKWVSMVSGRRVIYQCLGAPRKQNSYNSGVWLDYTTQTVENQEVLWLPTNDDTRTIKIEDTAIDGISKFTLAQDQFDPSRDNAELMIANYYESYVEPELPELEETPTFSDLEITYAGKPAVRAGGGYKKFTLKARVDGVLVDATGDTEWKIDFTDGDPSKLEHSVSGSIFKVKCLNDYSLIGKTFTVTATNKHSSKSIIVEVISL